jgi:hypothetical protein
MTQRTCVECDKPPACRGYCHGHYWKIRRYGDPLGSSPRQQAPRFELTDDLDNSKVCTICELRLPCEAFHKSSRSKDGLQTRCRNCYRDWYNQRYQDNAEFREKRSEHFAKFYEEKYPSRRERHNDTRRYGMYGITRAQFDAMVAEQGGVCAICKQPPSGHGPQAVLAVDHNHDSGLIRGLLCSPCNMAIGLFRENPDVLAAAIRYLEETKPGQLPLFAA